VALDEVEAVEVGAAQVEVRADLMVLISSDSWTLSSRRDSLIAVLDRHRLRLASASSAFVEVIYGVPQPLIVQHSYYISQSVLER
jgi:hypothetical protein